MGVPILTLKGDRYLFHFGESINSNLAMDEWVADNLKEYVSKAIKFSSNFKYLSDVRLNLREKALKSPVFNSQRFSEHFSKLLWGMWEIYDRKN